MSGAGGDVAALLRLKASREKAVFTAQQVQSAAMQSRQDAISRRQQAARARWPGCLKLLQDCVKDYQEKSYELGVTTTVEELHRLRAWLPDIAVSFVRNDGTLGTRVLFRMASDGNIGCTIRQILGPTRANLNRAEYRVSLSESSTKQILKAIVQVLILETGAPSKGAKT